MRTTTKFLVLVLVAVSTQSCYVYNTLPSDASFDKTYAYTPKSTRCVTYDHCLTGKEIEECLTDGLLDSVKYDKKVKEVYANGRAIRVTLKYYNQIRRNSVANTGYYYPGIYGCASRSINQVLADDYYVMVGKTYCEEDSLEKTKRLKRGILRGLIKDKYDFDDKIISVEPIR